MNNKKNEDQDFEVLGFKVRFKSQVGDNINAEKVVELFNQEAEQVIKQYSNLNNEQLAILVSLKIAADKLSIENDYKHNVERLRSTALDALHLIKEVSPSPL